jgi:hypothetical protein
MIAFWLVVHKTKIINYKSSKAHTHTHVRVLDLYFCAVILAICIKKIFMYCTFKCALSKQTRRMSSIKELIVKKFIKIKPVAASAVSYSALRVPGFCLSDSETLQKEAGCIEKRKPQL